MLDQAVIDELRKNLFIEPVINSILGDLQSDVSNHMKNLKIKLLGLNKKKVYLGNKHYSLIDKIADSEIDLNEYVQRNLDTYKNEMREIDNNISQLNSRMGLPLKKFGSKQKRLFVDACKHILLGGNEEATKALLNAVIEKIVIKKNMILIQGNKLKLMANIACFDIRNLKFRVPSLISIWQRGQDLNLRPSLGL
ncbi:hypothetical protein A9R01_09660 ['Osedax' symbiont bacterium Rs2_46_30_T18]|nr:hypothetical protein A9R01_09660 ['Osedax' symbiont bacterium Rs2_46_30_T18]